MKIAVAGLIIVLMAVGFYVVSWSDKYKEIESLEAQKGERLAQKERLEADVAQLPKFREEAAGLEKELLSLVQSKFTKEEPELFVANYIAEIERLVADQQEVTGDDSFRILSITPRGEQVAEAVGGADEEEAGGDKGKAGEKKEGAAGAPAAAESGSETLQGFPTRVFAMEMTGRYATLVEFLYQLGALELDRLVTINEISLKPKTTEGETGSPVLSITIPITAYLRQGSN
jgi:Tfp pilus assembly protein PilO